MERIWRYTSSTRTGELRDTLFHRDRASVEMHLEVTIMRTWRPRSSELGDALGGCNRVSLVIYTWRP